MTSSQNPTSRISAGLSFSKLHFFYSLPVSPILSPEASQLNVMGDQTIQPTPESPEIIAFATRMYDAARQGDIPIFEQALPAGLPPNMTNDKGDSLVRSSPTSLKTCHPSSPVSRLTFPTSHHTPGKGTLLKLLKAHALHLSRSRSTFPSSPLSRR